MTGQRAAEPPRRGLASDVHAHYYPPEYVAVVREVAAERGPHADVARAFLEHPIISAVPAFTGDLEGRLRLMDEAAIGVQVLSFASSNIWHPEAAVRARLVRAYNDGCSAAAAASPDRLRFLASLPLPHVDEAVEEARRARDLPGCVGYSLPTHIDAAALDSPAWEPVLAAMAELPCLVLTHPDGFCARGVLADHGMEWALGAPFEDTVAAVRLVAGGVLERHPDLTWVVPHLGGTLPFLLHRLLWRWELEAKHLGTPAHRADSLGRLLFDTANCSAPTLRLALEVLPAGRVVLGTDFPFLDPEDLRRPVELVRGATAPAGEVDDVLADRLRPFLGAPTTATPRTEDP